MPDDDNLAEGDETFTVTLSNPSNATLATAQATGTITDSDVLEVSVAAEAVTVQEGQDAVFTVAVAGATSTADVSVGYSVSGTATAGEDYTAPSGTLTIAAGAASGTITIRDAGGRGGGSERNRDRGAGGGEHHGHGDRERVGDDDDQERRPAWRDRESDVADRGGRREAYVHGGPRFGAHGCGDGVGEGAAGNGCIGRSRRVLTFTTGDWSTVQTVTVRAAQDDDAVADDAATIGHTVSSTGDYDGEIVSDVAVTITDDDRRGVTVSPASLTVEEGDDNTYTVVLDSQPTAAVTVTVNVPSSTDVSASPTRLTFTADDWSTARTVTVSAEQDDDALMDDAVTVGHTVGSTGDYSGETAADVAVMITETDTPTLSIADVSAPESARSMTFTVSSSVASSRTVTVGWATGNATATAGEDYTAVTTGRVTFSPRGTLRQAISVTIADDDVDEDAETFEVTLSGAQNAALAGGQTTLAVTATITDDDQRGVTVNPTSLTVEEGSSKPYTVVLRSQPTEEVTVSASVPSDTDVSASPTSLTFTADDWSTARTVTVSVAEDDDADVDAAVTITHAVSGGDYGDNNATASNVSVTITETDTPTRALALAKTTAAVNFTGVGTGIGYSYEAENSGTVTLTGTLAVEDDKIRASRISCDAVPEGGLVPGASLTCTGSYTVTQADVDVAEVTNTAIATLDGVMSNEATETVPWAQSQQQKPVLSVPAVVNPPNAVIGQESGGALAFPVSLSRTSAQTVTVSFETSDGTATAGDDYTATDGTLTFAPGTTERTISVTIANDDLDEADESFKVRLSQVVNATLPGGTATLEVTGTIADDDERGVTVSPTSLTVAEGDDKPYTVALATQPTGQVTVSIGGTTGTDLMVDKSSLTFTASDWRTVQTVTVTAGEDDDGSSDSETLTHTAAGADYGSVTEDLPVTVTDDDTAGIVLTPTALQVTEGSDAAYTVELSTEPSGQVTVTVGGANGTDLTVGNGSLTFTASTWNTAQTVAVGAGQDDDGTNDSVTLTHTAAGADYGSVTEDLPVTVTDDDTAGIVLVPPALGVTEGESESYTVELATEPSGEVTVTVGGAAGTDLTVVNPSLTFTASTWNTAQTVAVRADQDDDAWDDSATLTHTASGGDYGSVSKYLPVTVTDIDSAGIVLTPTLTLRVTEGSSATYTVELSTEPSGQSGQVTVTVGGTSGTDLTVVNGSLTFTASTWNTAQTVEVRAGQDDDASDDSATLTHTASGADYGSVSRNLPVTVTDDETAGIALTTAPTSVREDDSATEVTVTATLGGSCDAVQRHGGDGIGGRRQCHLRHRLPGGGELQAHHRGDRVQRDRDVHADPDPGQHLRGRRDDRRDRRRQRLHRHQGGDDAHGRRDSADGDRADDRPDFGERG